MIPKESITPSVIYPDRREPMNILVINGSPKGTASNTYRLTEAFLNGLKVEAAQSNDSVLSIETLLVSKLHIKPCLGCFSCWNKTPGECCIKDDMSAVIEKMLWADLTIWSFPLYYFSVPGPLKTLIDRQLPMVLPFMKADSKSGGHPSRYDMSGKKTVLISTCGFYTPSGNYTSVTEMFDRLCGKNNYLSLFCGEGELFRVRELSERTDQYLALVSEAGMEYGQNGMVSDRILTLLSEPLYPREVFEAMADASWGITESGEKADESLIFTRQMAALYNKQAYPGKDLILDMDYTDIGKTYRIILGKDGSRVTEDFSGQYTTCIHTPYSVWCSIAAGEIEGADAMMRHLYTVDGDFDLMLHWDDYFGVPGTKKAEKPTDTAISKTNMTVLLLPWILFWVAAPINSFWGSLAAIAVCGTVPVFFFRNRKTLYDCLSVLAVIVCSILLLIGIPALYVIPASYFLFGLMWSVSCFTAIPLTAHYSANDYGGEKMMNNPVFMRTNQILTAAWGILYLLTPIWTYFLMRTALDSYIGAVNSVLPALMGGFTAWFQKWYPRKVARG